MDNTPPTISLVNPGSQLSGEATVSAEAKDSGSGVASVRFQAHSVSGSGGWKDIGEATLPVQPNIYSRTLNTESLQNGPYELRAIAEDKAGNETTSPLADVTIDNQSSAPAVSATIAGVAAPAQGIRFLGSIAGSSQHEAWAYGFTSAPPAEVDGSRLPYTAQGEQLVLLRYTDDGGWQIADVLREPNGSPFPLLPADKVSSVNGGPYFPNQVHVAGAMTPSGEAWLWVAESSTEKGRPAVVGLFHRSPGGEFLLDSKATKSLSESSGGVPALLGSQPQNPGELDVSVRLGESNGQAYGMLTAPGQAEQTETGEKLQYGLLQDGEWKLETTPTPPGATAEHKVTLKLADAEGPGEGWGAFEVSEQPGLGLILGHLEGGKWTFPATGLDALDLTGAVGEASKGEGGVEPVALKADGSAVWIEAEVKLPPNQSFPVVARYEGSAGASAGHVTNSWCTLPVANSCEEPLDTEHPAAVPDAIFQTGGEEVALALNNEFVDVFSHDKWTSVAAPGYGRSPSQAGEAVFAEPNEGWVGGATALGHWSAEGASGQVASWPLPDRSPLTSVALPPESQGEVGDSGALAVGFNGTTLSYDASAGWLVQPAPPRAHHINLLGVAFAGPSSAFAVGQFGVILHWDGTAWSEDPQSIALTQSQLNAVAFAPSGEGWAVGVNGTILHYDGQSWSKEEPPKADSGVDITSVAVAGSEAFAVANGNLIALSPGGQWQEVGGSELPSSPAFTPGSLRLVAGLPDGGVVAAGRSVVLVREGAGQGFAYAAQPLEGIAVALAPFREADGKLRAYVSVAPPASGRGDVAGYPPGDGELLRQTASGWQDLSHAQFAGSEIAGDGAIKSDPVLAVATGPSGDHAWAVGGYDGTEDAAGQGTEESLSSRPVGWQTASVWRYDTTGSAQPPELSPATPNLPANQGTVSFAFFTSPMCKEECAASLDAQPAVNLTSAAKQIASYAAQPGGPAFAMLGGNAVGPLEGSARQAGKGAADFAHLPELLAPLGGLPTFAALGIFDNVPGRADETQPWAEAFSGAPPPFGSGPEAPGITPVSSGAPTPSGEVHRYYAFDAAQNGGTARVIVLDNSEGSLEKSAEGQRAWLQQQLTGAQEAGLPVVVVTSRPLRSLHTANGEDGEEVASLLANSGVLAVFTTNGASPGNASEVHELDQHSPRSRKPGPGRTPDPGVRGRVARLPADEEQRRDVVFRLDRHTGARSPRIRGARHRIPLAEGARWTERRAQPHASVRSGGPAPGGDSGNEGQRSQAVRRLRRLRRNSGAELQRMRAPELHVRELGTDDRQLR